MIKNRVVALATKVSKVPLKRIGVERGVNILGYVPIIVIPNQVSGNDGHQLNHLSLIAEKAREIIMEKLIVIEELLGRANGAKSDEVRNNVLAEINESEVGNNYTNLHGAIIHLQQRKRNLEEALGKIKLD